MVRVPSIALFYFVEIAEIIVNRAFVEPAILTTKCKFEQNLS